MKLPGRNALSATIAVVATLFLLTLLASASAGTVTVSITPNVVEEGQDATLTFTLSPVNPSRNTKVIYYLDGTASFGDDYTLSGSAGIVVIPRGQASADVTVSARADGHFDRTEEAIFVVGDGNRYRPGTPHRARLMITDVN